MGTVPSSQMLEGTVFDKKRFIRISEEPKGS